MTHDSIVFILSIPDTIKVLNTDSNVSTVLKPQYIGLIGVIIGALISIIGNYLLANRAAKIQIKNTFFQKRLEIYTKITELSWEGYSVKVRHEKGEEGDYPIAYDSYEDLRKWINSLVEIMDKNRLLLDQGTYNQFIVINHKLLEHLREIKEFSNIDNIDIETRKIGRKNVNNIQQLCESFVDSARKYMKKTYDLNLEKVI
jgi:hypothetical protein